jgi:hypothetical protein
MRRRAGRGDPVHRDASRHRLVQPSQPSERIAQVRGETNRTEHGARDRGDCGDDRQADEGTRDCGRRRNPSPSDAKTDERSVAAVALDLGDDTLEPRARDSRALPLDAKTVAHSKNRAVDFETAAAWAAEKSPLDPANGRTYRVGHADGGALMLKRYRHLYPSESYAAAPSLDALVAER